VRSLLAPLVPISPHPLFVFVPIPSPHTPTSPLYRPLKKARVVWRLEEHTTRHVWTFQIAGGTHGIHGPYRVSRSTSLASESLSEFAVSNSAV
jgi:hypothetical protein